jgi:hypothetical protein
MRQHAPPELWYLATQLHVLTSQKTALFIVTAVRVSKQKWVMIVRLSPLNMLDNFLFGPPVPRLIDIYNVYYSEVNLKNNYILQHRNETISCSPVLMGSLASFFMTLESASPCLLGCFSRQLGWSSVGTSILIFHEQEVCSFWNITSVEIVCCFSCRIQQSVRWLESTEWDNNTPAGNEILGYRKYL